MVYKHTLTLIAIILVYKYCFLQQYRTNCNYSYFNIRVIDNLDTMRRQQS